MSLHARGVRTTHARRLSTVPLYSLLFLLGCTHAAPPSVAAAPSRPAAPVTAAVVPPAPACSAGNPTTAAGWAAAMKATALYGDGMISVALDARRCAFVTGDATPRDGSAWAHSSITVVAGGKARPLKPGRYGPSPYQVAPDYPDGSYNWLGSSFTAGGRLYSFAPRVRPSTAWPYFEALGTDLLWFRYGPTTDPTFAGRTPLPADPGGVSWGAGVWYDQPSGLVYILGSQLADGWTGYSLRAARVPLGLLGDVRAWRYLTDAGGWAAGRQKAAPVLTAADGGTESTVSFWRDRAGWHVTSRRGGHWGTGITRWTTSALRPAGTWSQLTLVTAEKLAGQQPYIAYEHAAIPLGGGSRALTWNTAGNDATWTAVPR